MTIRSLMKMTGTLILLLSIAVGCSKRENVYQGYIEGDLRYMASNFSGVLSSLLVKEGDHVTKGQSLFTLENLPQLSNYQEATSKLDVTQADINKFNIQVNIAKNKLIRRQQLGAGKYSSQEDIDNANFEYKNVLAQLESAKANLKQNQAEIESTKWAYQKKEVTASVDGIVFDIFYREGEFVGDGKPVLSLLAPEDVKIIFFVPQKDIGKINMNQEVLVNCDGCPNPLKARISFISPKAEFTPPVIYSDQTKTKFTFLIEARTDIPTSKRLHPGQPSTVTLH